MEIEMLHVRVYDLDAEAVIMEAQWKPDMAYDLFLTKLVISHDCPDGLPIMMYQTIREHFNDVVSNAEPMYPVEVAVTIDELQQERSYQLFFGPVIKQVPSILLMH